MLKVLNGNIDAIKEPLFLKVCTFLIDLQIAKSSEYMGGAQLFQSVLSLSVYCLTNIQNLR